MARVPPDPTRGRMPLGVRGAASRHRWRAAVGRRVQASPDVLHVIQTRRVRGVAKAPWALPPHPDRV